MTDDEVAQMGREVRREQDGGMVIVVIVLVSALSALAGCSVAWVLMRAFGW